ncbi:MAG: hypothetical protein COX57_13705, partial [Alphaproteobacteria bacterium CG_4_10_14_0_2_um_filter_63_37]
TWSVMDAAGNTGSATQLVTVTDSTAPAVTAPAAVTVEATGVSTTATLGTATASDLVDGTLTAVADNTGPFVVGTTTVTWSVTDTAGNVGSATQLVTVTDTTAPSLTVPNDITFDATDAAGIASNNAAVATYLAGASASDLVDGTITVTNNAPLTFALGNSRAVAFTATDAAGNSISLGAIVTVLDQSPPIVTPPTDILLAANIAAGYSGSDSLLTGFLAGASANDLVDGSISVSNDAPTDFPLGDTVVNFSATDAAGNTGSITATVTVTDQTAPVITPPADITLPATNNAGVVTAGSGTLSSFLIGVSATDLIDGAIPVGSIANDAPTTFPIGDTVVTFSAIDAAGNSDTATATVSITDVATVSTLAGQAGVAGHLDDVGINALFSAPAGIASDGLSLYVAEQGGNFIRQVNPITGVVTTLAGDPYGAPGYADGYSSSARFNFPSGLAATDSNLFVADQGNNAIRKIHVASGTPTSGLVSTLAGDPYSAPGFVDGGLAAPALFNAPAGVATDGINVYVADSGNNAIRKIVIANGLTTTLAGDPYGSIGFVDSYGAAARFSTPMGVATDGTSVYVADSANNAIRKIAIATGLTTTLAGDPYGTPGTSDGTGTAANFNFPTGLVCDGAALYVSDQVNSAIRKIDLTTTEVTTIAGQVLSAGHADGVAASALFSSPAGLTILNNRLYVADVIDHTLRSITRIASTDTTLGYVTIQNLGGPLATTTLFAPIIDPVTGQTLGLAQTVVSETGSFYTVLTPGQYNVTFAVDGHSNTQTDLSGNSAATITIADGSNVIDLGTAYTFGGTVAVNVTGAGVPVDARIDFTPIADPYSLAVSGLKKSVAASSGSITVGLVEGRYLVTATPSDPYSSSSSGVGMSGGSVVEVVAANSTATPSTVDIALNAKATGLQAGNIQAAPLNLSPGKVTTWAGTSGLSGSNNGVGLNAQFGNSEGITSDGTSLFVADLGSHTIRQIDIATGTVTTLAGQSDVAGNQDGVGHNATFNGPYAITTDGTSLFVSDYWNRTIRKIDIATGTVSTLAGIVGTAGSNDGPGNTATFGYINGLTTDGVNLYLTDGHYTVRQVDIATGVVSTLAGTTGVWGFSDGSTASALFYGPKGLVVVGSNLFVADNNRIRQIDLLTATVSTLAGSGSGQGGVSPYDGVGIGAAFVGLRQLASDGTYLYATDTNGEMDALIRRIDIATATVTTLAGNAVAFGTPADGIGTIASFSYPSALVCTSTAVFVTDSGDNTIRKIEEVGTGTVSGQLLGGGSPLAGSIAFIAVIDPVTGQVLGYSQSVATDANGNYSVTLYSGSYNIVATPDAASGYASTVPTTGGIPTQIDVATNSTPTANVSANAAPTIAGLLGGTIQGTPLSANLMQVTTLAGDHYAAPASVDGTGTSALFAWPFGITTDGTSLFVTEDATIRRIDLASGDVSTFVGDPAVYDQSRDGIGSAAYLYYPNGITTDGVSLFFCEGDVVRKADIATGLVSTLAGSTNSWGFVDGVGAAAQFTSASGVTVVGNTLYVTDTWNHAIRTVDILSGAVTTLAGDPYGTAGTADGIGSLATFDMPTAITTDGVYLYVTDNSSGLIRRVEIATGGVVTVAGSPYSVSGLADGVGASATFSAPNGIVTDGSSLYVSDSGHSAIRRIDLSTWQVTTLAGASTRTTGSIDGIGTNAIFVSPSGLTSDGTNLYVADYDQNAIRKISDATGGSVAGTVSGNGGPQLATVTFTAQVDPITGQILGFDQTVYSAINGTYAVTLLTGTYDVAVQGSGFAPLFDTYSATGVVSASGGTATPATFDVTLSPTPYGTVTTVAGVAGTPSFVDGVALESMFNGPSGITGNAAALYVVDQNNSAIRKIDRATSMVSTFAGSAVGTAGYLDGTGTGALFGYPYGIANDGAYLYVTDNFNNAIRKIDLVTAQVVTLAGDPYGTAGSLNGTGSGAQFSAPAGIASDGVSLFVADYGNNTIRQIDPASGVVTTLAGDPYAAAGSVDGIGALASFNGPAGLACDGVNLYVADQLGHVIRRVDIASGNVTTIAGTAGTSGFTDGAGSSALFLSPSDLETDGTTLYVGDWGNNAIRAINLATSNVTTVAGGTSGSFDGVGASAQFMGINGLFLDGGNLFGSDGASTIRQVVIAP